LISLLECDFSTTTNNSLAANRIVPLDTIKAYFSYKITLACGIPEKVIKLRQLNLDLNFWLDRLAPVICKLIETYKR